MPFASLLSRFSLLNKYLAIDINKKLYSSIITLNFPSKPIRFKVKTKTPTIKELITILMPSFRMEVLCHSQGEQFNLELFIKTTHSVSIPKNDPTGINRNLSAVKLKKCKTPNRSWSYSDEHPLAVFLSIHVVSFVNISYWLDLTAKTIILIINDITIVAEILRTSTHLIL